jgi:hypothetical protein
MPVAGVAFFFILLPPLADAQEHSPDGHDPIPAGIGSCGGETAVKNKKQILPGHFTNPYSFKGSNSFFITAIFYPGRGVKSSNNYSEFADELKLIEGVNRPAHAIFFQPV